MEKINKELKIAFAIKQEFNKQKIHLDILKLQKILGYCAILYYYKYKEHLFQENFKAGEYGVVLESTGYEKEIISNFNGQAKIELKLEITKIIEEVVQKKGKMGAIDLSEENHQQIPGSKTREQGFNSSVPQKLIEKHAKEIVEKFLD